VSWQSTPYTWPLTIAALTSAALTAHAVLRRRVPGAKLFALVTASLTLWSAAYAFELASGTLAAQMAWLDVRYVGVLLMPFVWLAFCLQYTGHDRRLTPRTVGVGLGVCAAFWIALVTNGAHGLFWRDLRLAEVDGLLKWQSTLGPLYWINVAWSYALLLVGDVLLLHALARSPRVHVGQAVCLLLATSVPTAANAAYQAGWQPLGFVDPTPPALTISALLMSWALFRYGFLTLVPVARYAVVDGLRDPVIVLDPAGRIVDLNPAARLVLGPQAGSALGEACVDVFGPWPEATGPGFPEMVRNVDGDRRTYEVRISSLAGGRRPGRLVVLADVTERRRAEDAIARQNQHLQALLESGRVISAGLDLPRVLQNIAEEAARLVDGEPGGIGLVRDGKVVFDSLWASGSWEQANVSLPLGDGAAGGVASSATARIVNDATVLVAEPLGRYAVPGFIDVPISGRGGAVTGVLHVRRRARGRPFEDADRELLESLARQAAIAIENAALFGTVLEKGRALESLYEHERRLSASLQALSVMKNNFMIVTSHELRTPLTVLRGYHELLTEGALAGPAAAQALEVCRRTTERMVSGLEDILEMLQLDEGRVRLAPRTTDVAALVHEVAREIEPFARRRGQTLRVANGSVLEACVDVDKIRLVLHNLVENAVKFTPDGGHIRLTVELQEEQIHVVVEDDGIGIEPAELDRIFERFYTGPDALHHRSGHFEFETRGAGLGLALVRGHCEAHGGCAWAESDGRGHGSRFHVVLPRVPAGGLG
jgi:signal transduction histidine kinase